MPSTFPWRLVLLGQFTPISRAKSKFDVSFRECTLWNFAFRLRFASSYTLGLWGLRDVVANYRLSSKLGTEDCLDFVLATFKPKKVRQMLNFETRHVSMISVGQGSQRFSFPSYVLRFCFHQKNNGFSTKKTVFPTNPTNPEFKWGPKSRSEKNSAPNQPTNQTFNPIPTNLSDDLIFQHHDFHPKRRFRTAFSRWSLTTSTTCPVESLWGADSICTAELVYSVLECSEFLTDKRNIQILGGWIVWKIT